ncbi:hypothetical protein BDW68DRAFT_180919 [Aspergillus falconensis]
MIGVLTQSLLEEFYQLGLSGDTTEFIISDGTIWAIIEKCVATYESSFANRTWTSIGNLNDYINNFARTMTHALRICSPSCRQERPLPSTAYNNETYTRVRWAWLAFPAAMPVWSYLMLLETVWHTKRRLVGAGKARTLVLLCILMGNSLWEAAMGRITEDGEVLDKMAGKERVRSSPVDRTWQSD